VGVLLECAEVCARSAPVCPQTSPGLRPGVSHAHQRLHASPGAGTGNYFGGTGGSARRLGSALTLLVARVRAADDHDPAVPPDDPAVVADPLDARLDLHGVPNSRCAPVWRPQARPLP